MNLPAEQQQTLDRALNLHGGGNLDEAEKLYRELLEKSPEQADALHYLGVTGLQRGKFEEAVSFIQRAVDARPDYVDALVNLGYGLNALGRPDEAVQQFERALAIGPATAPLLANLGGTLEQLRRFPDAIEKFEAALQLEPELAEVRRSLADTYLKMNRPDDALREITQAVSQGQPSLAMRLSQGNILSAAGRLDDAIACFEQVLQAQPTLAPVLGSLARTLRRNGKFDEAIEAYRKLLSQDSDNVEAHFDLGTVFHDLGRTDAALKEFRKAVRLDADCAKAWHGIATVTKEAFTAEEVTSLLDRQQAADILQDERILLAFALGKQFENSGQHDEAAAQYQTGNPIRRAEFDFDIEDHLRTYDNLRTCFDAAFFDMWSEAGLENKSPIFIIGMPRSGTTLVEQILASHPRVHGAGERELLTDSILSTFPITNGVDYTDTLGGATTDNFHSVAKRYLAGFAGVEAEFVTDKMPHNFLNVGMIRILFPKASIVHCRRNPRDTCFSIYKHLFRANSHPYAYELSELARYYNAYEELMRHWESVLPGTIHSVDYEAMIDSQEQTTRELLDACGLEWDPACLEFHKHERPIATLSATQVRQPVYRGSVDAWKNYEKMLEPLLEVLN
jgi:tetratricopeptide (TPR) repeat protein